MSFDDELMRERYGENYSAKNGRWKIAAALFAVLLIPWLIWSAWYYSKPDYRYELVSFTITSQEEIALTYVLDRKVAGISVTCTLIARDFEKNIVGEISETFLANQAPIREVRRVVIPTRSPAVNGGISQCDRR
jgi:di/tricarboxylate transporter